MDLRRATAGRVALIFLIIRAIILIVIFSKIRQSCSSSMILLVFSGVMETIIDTESMMKPRCSIRVVGKITFL